jgi:16S rRNA (guanine1207-N2)-methyltransferase
MRFSTPLGSFELKRYPLRQNESLQAWDAADEYLLNHIAAQALPGTRGAKSRALVINDQFGALAIALQDHTCVSWGDSVVAHRGALANFKRNGFDNPPLCLPATEAPDGTFDLVLLKIPKTLALLEHQLAGLAGHLTRDSLVVAAGMVKSIHRSTLELFTRYLGPTTTSLATKKARLIFPALDPLLAGATPPSPYPSQYQWDQTGVMLCNHANVFSREQLDIGARAMLAVIDKLPASKHIVDLGCGNGILGISAGLAQPGARLCFIDESYMAVASARQNWKRVSKRMQPESAVAEFFANDCFDGLELAAPDLVICNPPFHQGHAIGDHIAWRMFKQSHDCLRQGGELWIVGNKHLHYPAKLKRLFGACTEQYANRKFAVHSARKR